MSTSRPWAATSARYGTLGEHGDWRIAIEHYYWDRLEPAFELAQSLGLSYGAAYVRWYRLIEAEHATRQAGRRERVNDWLELETVPAETADAEGLAQEVLAVCEKVGRRFRWEHGAATLVSVLTEEADAPWTIGRYGYMTDKYPFDKICIPHYATTDAAELERVVSHEYAHVISLNLSSGLVPRWLDEAIAQVAGQDMDDASRRAFASGAAPWLSPHDLELAFGAEREDALDGRRLWLAYQQSSQIGRFLVHLKGEAGLGDLLRAFSNNSVWTDLKLRLTGRPEVDEALGEVYGLSTTDLFAQTLDRIKGAAFS